MKDLDTLYNEGKSLMEQALVYYSKKQINEAEECRKKANDTYDKANKLYCLENTDRDKLYGKNRNFGICYHIFEDSLLKNMKSRNGQKFINEVSNLIKRNKVLKEQFDIYNSICNKKNVSEPEKYVDGIMECVSRMNIDRKEVKEMNDKLIDLIESNSNVDKLSDISPDTLKLYEDVEYIITNRKTINNIDEFNRVKNSLTEKFNKSKGNTDVDNVSESYEKTLSEISEKYDDLSDDELKLVESIISKNTDKTALFNSYKKETLDNVDEAISKSSDEDKEQWVNIKNALNEKKYDEKKVVDDILNFIEIQKNL